MTGDIIKVKAQHRFTMYPKPASLLGTEDNTYGIVKWFVVETLQGEVPIYSEITITGTYGSPIDISKEYTILAKEIEHAKYGKQYQVMFVGEVTDFTNAYNQKAFLSTILTEDQIRHIYEITDNPIKVIANHDIETLTKAWGIGEYIANCIIERFEANQDNCAVYIELDGLGLTPNFIQKLIKHYKNPQQIIKIVKTNPYQLCLDVDGIGFKTADEIALKNGLDMYSPNRISAFIVYYLEDEAQNGNSYITSRDLTTAIFNMFGGKDEILMVYDEDDNTHTCPNNIAEAIHILEQKKIICVEGNENPACRRVYLIRYYKIEKQIAQHLKRIKEGTNNFVFSDWENKITEQEKRQGWELTDEQKAGVKMCLEQQIVFITGYGGTGKSSVLAAALNALDCMGDKPSYSFSQCSLSGKAAARMTEVTGADGYTIHRLLGWRPAGFTYTEENPLPYDIIVVDEISLVGGEIFLSLLQAIRTGSKLIVLGDMGQLESIGIMNLAHDLFYSEYIPTVSLTKIHRQAQKSGIIVASQQVRKGEQICKNNTNTIETIGELQDMTFDLSKDKDDIRTKTLECFKSIYESEVNMDIMDIQVLAPIKERGEANVYNLNNDIQEYLNPQTDFVKKEIAIVSSSNKVSVLREGDKVMCIKNNYKTLNLKGKETPIMNGWTGILKSIDTVTESAIIYFNIIKQEVVLSKSELSADITLGYACTVHKYQGSSAKNVICVLDYSTPPFMRTKELLYTMITRAEKKCVLIAQSGAVCDSINQSGISDKNTFLLELLDNNN